MATVKSRAEKPAPTPKATKGSKKTPTASAKGSGKTKSTVDKMTPTEEKVLTGNTESGNVHFNAATPQQNTQERITMAIKKTDAEGFMIDETGNRVLTAGGEPIRLRVPKKYNEAGQQVDDNGVVILGKNGQPKTRPVRDLGQKVIAKKLRGQIDACNAILALAKAKGIEFEITYDVEASPALALGEMQVIEKL